MKPRLVIPLLLASIGIFLATAALVTPWFRFEMPGHYRSAPMVWPRQFSQPLVTPFLWVRQLQDTHNTYYYFWMGDIGFCVAITGGLLCLFCILAFIRTVVSLHCKRLLWLMGLIIGLPSLCLGCGYVTLRWEPYYGGAFFWEMTSIRPIGPVLVLFATILEVAALIFAARARRGESGHEQPIGS